ncbi:MAG: zinc-ribbon and DUF3426 domain-containing protein [Pseudomonadota bacterium]|nr:zinc-ribbon and DUF3426 domain-containing protein [Pseudomonadota bacterium]
METRCPGCQTRYEVTELQLSAALGQVRCGLCHRVFNARQQSPEPCTVAEPANNDQPGEGNMKPAPLQTPVSRRARAMALPATPEQRQHWEALSRLDLEPDGPSAKPTPSKRVLVLCALATLTLGAQWGYFERNWLLSHPHTRPGLEALSTWLGQDLPSPVAMEFVEVVRLATSIIQAGRGVALDLVLLNRAATPQPYPALLVQYLDAEQQATAARTLPPQRYVRGELSVSAGIPPQTAVHVHLELAPPAADAPARVSLGLLQPASP